MPESYDPGHAGIDDSVDGEPITTMRSLVSAVERFTVAVSSRYGFSHSESVALRELESSGSLTPGDIAARTGLTSSSVTNLIDRLERTGHARRRAHPGDRRSVLVDLTESGSAALAWSRSALVHAYDGIAADDLPKTMASLRSIAESLDRHAVLAGGK
jgi:DNA-binding MarR family transcriptional regulator